VAARLAVLVAAKAKAATFSVLEAQLKAEPEDRPLPDLADLRATAAARLVVTAAPLRMADWWAIFVDQAAPVPLAKLKRRGRNGYRHSLWLGSHFGPAGFGEGICRASTRGNKEPADGAPARNQ
jgi:hypothetical protein